MSFKVLCVDHVGIAVGDLQKTKQLMKDLLGMEPTQPDETVEEQHVTTSFFKPSPQSDACELEFLGSTSPDGPIARYIAKNGGKDGYQHICLRVDDIEAALAALPDDAKLDKHWRVGAGGCHIAFMHPKATRTLIELTERPGGPSFKD
ncbi:putative methylmalonyl-CoA epimerase [Veillonellaceae bacterium DNF00626]|jgi:hypothetical protein|nr:putative methylmalonyl-CoA epimerase [Veillonellaceae bacterium DNF00626]